MKAIQVESKGLDEDKRLILNAYNEDGSFVALNHWVGKIDTYMRSTAMELAKKLGYRGIWVGDKLPSGDFAFICIDPEADLIMGVRE